MSTAHAAVAQAKVAAVRSAPRRPGEASFAYVDSQFGKAAIKVLPGEFFVDQDDIVITTTLGSCIAACIWDRDRRIGGMNHFLLPDGVASGAEAGRYGSYAMELLINALLKRGASRASLEAKVFGGGAVIEGMTSLAVGERNTKFVLEYLQAERIPLVSKDVMSTCARKVCFLPASGRALVKRLQPTRADELIAKERQAARTVVPVASQGGTVDLF